MAIPGLESAIPLVRRLPGVLQEDDFVQRFVSAFDDVLAPVLATLDSLASYFDPHLAPFDFLTYLAGWVGVELDDSWDMEQSRAVVAGAAVFHGRCGTVRGVRESLAVGLGVAVEVSDTGGCGWSSSPGSDLPGEGLARITVRIAAGDRDAIDVRRVERLLEASKPAHVAHEIVVGEEPVSS